MHGAGTRNALGFGTSGSEDRPPRRRRPAGEPPAGSDDPDADPEAVARTIVLRKLAAQARTRSELEKALKAKDVPDDAARSVLDRMEAVGLVDDQGFARDWVESRQQRRYLSKGALRRELSAKGVDADEIESALSTVEREDELEAARQLAAKKIKSMVSLERPVQYRRLVGALGRRGFSSAIVGRVVNETLDLSEG
ncbi:MAG: regulatory protein RecX [Propionibacteriaceae bacterium]